MSASFVGRLQSGQMQQTVNLPSPTSEVRILLSPPYMRGNSSVGRASAFQAEGREFEPRFPLQARVAQG